MAIEQTIDMAEHRGIVHDVADLELSSGIDISFGGDQKVSKKYSQNEWLAAEKTCSKFELAVGTCLDNLGYGITTQNDKQELFALGETSYLDFRDLLRKPIQMIIGDSISVEKKDAPVKQKKKGCNGKKNDKNKISKADLIRLENTRTRIESKITTVLSTLSIECFQPHAAFNSDIIEIKGMGLIYAGWYLFTNKGKYSKIKDLPFIFGIMVTMQRFLNVCAHYEGKSMVNNIEKTIVSSTLLSDINDWLKRLIEIFPYNGDNIYKYAPELLVITEYDKAVPSAGIKPREHQIQLIDSIKRNIDIGCFVIYNPMIGEGKTTMIRALARLVMKMRNTNPEHRFMQVIFACNLMSVKNQAANLCYNGLNGEMGPIKFGIASRDDSTGGYRISNHYLCNSNDERTVIITSPEIAAEILMDTSKDEIMGPVIDRTILYLDEPTIGADMVGSTALTNNMSVITVLPKYAIMSSATFPDEKFIGTILDHYKDKYPRAAIDTVYSAEIRINCDVYTYSKDLVVPHLGTKTASELSYVIDVIKKSPFLGRVYTPHVVKSLYEKMISEHIENVPDINKLFMNVDNMSSNEVRKIAMKMLELLSEQSDDLVTKICSSAILAEEQVDMTEKSIEKKPMSAFVWESDDCDDDPSTPLDFDKLGTTQGWRCPNPTLIATPTPVEFVRKHFAAILNDIYKSEINFDSSKMEDGTRIYKSTANVIKMYEKEMALFEKQKLSLEKNTENEERLLQVMQDFEDMKPVLKFPGFGHINSMEHTQKYSRKHANKLVGRYVRSPVNLEKMPFDTSTVADDLLTLLFAGVGIYVSNHPEIDDAYLQTVLDMASDGKLAYIVADNSICFGTNYPINYVIITDEFAEEHSINTLFQLMGRTGRTNKSWKGTIYVSNTIAKRIINYTRNMGESEIEAKNMISEFTKILKRREEQSSKTLEKVLAKFMTKSNDTSSKLEKIRTPPKRTSPTIKKVSEFIEEISLPSQASTQSQITKETSWERAKFKSPEEVNIETTIVDKSSSDSKIDEVSDRKQIGMRWRKTDFVSIPQTFTETKSDNIGERKSIGMRWRKPDIESTSQISAKEVDLETPSITSDTSDTGYRKQIGMRWKKSEQDSEIAKSASTMSSWRRADSDNNSKYENSDSKSSFKFVSSDKTHKSRERYGDKEKYNRHSGNAQTGAGSGINSESWRRKN